MKVVARAHLDGGADSLRAGEEAVRLRLPGAEKALGDVHAARGEWPRALVWYEIAAVRSHAARRAVARALTAMGDPAEAAAAHRTALESARFVRVEDLEAYLACSRAAGWTGEARAAEEAVGRMKQ